MKLSLFLLLTSLASIAVSAQDGHTDYARALKLYNITSVNFNNRTEADTGAFFTKYDEKRVQFLGPALAFQWKSANARFHEIELTRFAWNTSESRSRLVSDSTGKPVQTLSGDRQTDIHLEARYEYIVPFKTKVNRKLSAQLGFAVSPYFLLNKTTPMTATSFETAYSRGGVRTSVIPRICYYFSPKWFFDLNMPIVFTDTGLRNARVENPAIPPGQRSISTFDFEAFSQGLQFRFGVGMKL